MPLYEYLCSSCAHRFERIVKFSDAPLTTCPECGRDTIEQVISAPAVQFKGSGWYVTDYARKGTPASSSTAKPESGSESASAPAGGTNSDSAPTTSPVSGTSEKASSPSPSSASTGAGDSTSGSSGRGPSHGRGKRK